MYELLEYNLFIYESEYFAETQLIKNEYEKI